MPPKEGYLKARKLLEQTFGQKHKIAMAHVEKLTNGGPIKVEYGDSLEQFSISLMSCSNTLKAIGYLSKIENPNALKRIIERLPYKLQERWRDVADKIMNDEGRDVTIEDVAKFIEIKARSMNNPVFGKLSYSSKDQNVKPKVPRQTKIPETESKSSTFATEVDDVKKKPCKECGGKHATLLHFSQQSTQDEAFKEKDTSKKSDQHEHDSEKTKEDCVDSRCRFTTTVESITALPVLPVEVRRRGTVDYIHMYALLDNGSNSTFCTESLRKRLGCNGTEKKIKLTTIGTRQDITTVMLDDLEITDLDENNLIHLPEVLCRPNIPVTKDEIPTQEDVDLWRYLHGYVHLPKINSEVELLIGANVPEALQPIQIINSQDGGPYASKVALGWVINGPVGRKLGTALHASFLCSLH
ncbi:uncharacterized protein LOC114540499 [Dendronephthya gigantea]|uniref:uncharacterized protein LOC114540499 n=1 Tax=Dendronephthya gigantea TaxID=151771 RepID=UPI00106C3F41|nr:uncharacterized protein LOC114540499 [Dendronephthya gigantea]